ncbi:hypothetical protein ACJRPK_16290 [Aquimarina sp. 2-A2]|uniref:hypothetical protein n=1 Tax=Aquimarina sp. 2-A2 TaxID=3382644 RepID=UPI00387F118C
MKFGIKRVWKIIIILIFFALIYNSKKEYYSNKVKFFDKKMGGVILDIKEGRGTKVYYAKEDFFYLEQLESKSIMIGDSLIKNGTELSVYRKNGGEKFMFLKKESIIKPNDSYFKFFFGL